MYSNILMIYINFLLTSSLWCWCLPFTSCTTQPPVRDDWPHGCKNFGVCNVTQPTVAPITCSQGACICNEGSTGPSCDIRINLCQNDTCRSPKECVETGIGKFDCRCANGNSGDDCLIDSRTPCGKLGNPCRNNGTCINQIGQNPPFTCNCATGYNGTLCQTAVDCNSVIHCQHGGICKYEFEETPRCKCPTNYTGRLCEHERDKITVTDSTLQCVTLERQPHRIGFCSTTRSDCSIDENNPSLQNRSVIWNRSGCLIFNEPIHNTDPNVTLSDCQQENNECTENANLYFYRTPRIITTVSDPDECNHGSPCGEQSFGACVDFHRILDHGKTYGCLCHPKYDNVVPMFGLPTRCSDTRRYPCAATGSNENFCLNGGTCVEIGNAAKCVCQDGFSGPRCDNIKRCDANPCKNGGVCTEDADEGYQCDCLTHYKGKKCEEVNICEYGKPCQNGGTCNNLPQNGTANVNFTCSCTEDYTGFNCEFERDFCRDIVGLCQNNGTCNTRHPGYECTCLPGSFGRNCSELVPHCNSTEPGFVNPCTSKDNNATCVDILNDYICNCTSEWAGRNCDINSRVYAALQVLCGNDTDCRRNANSMLTEIATNPGTAPNIVSYLVGSLNKTQRAELSYTKNETIVWASYEEKALNIENDISQWNDVVLGNCFTFNNMKGNATTFGLRTSGARGAFRILLDVTRDYPPWVETRGMQVFTHSQFEAIFSESVRYNAAPNGEVNLKIRSAKYQKLRKAFKEKCVSDVKDVKDYYYAGEYTTEGCRRACYQNAVHRDCGCMDPRYPKASSIAACALPKMDCVDDVLANSSFWEPGCNCPQACNSQQFYIQWSRVENILSNNDDETSEDSNSTDYQRRPSDLVEISISLPYLDFVIFEEQPAIDTQKLLSYLGGFLVVLWGASIHFIIEIIFIVCKSIYIVLSYKKHDSK